MCMYIDASVHVHMCDCLQVYMHVCVCLCACACVPVSVHACVCLYLFVCLYVLKVPYTSKHSRGKTFAVHQQYALCRENFRGLQT